MDQLILDAFSSVDNVNEEIRASLLKDAYSSPYLGLVMNLVHEKNPRFGDNFTYYFMDDIIRVYLHGDDSDQQKINEAAVEAYDQYVGTLGILDYRQDNEFFQIVNHYFEEHFSKAYNPADYENFINGYIITRPLDTPELVEGAINEDILQDRATGDDLSREITPV